MNDRFQQKHYDCNMETIIVILAILAGIIGIAGSILPGLTDTPVSWIGLLLIYIRGAEEMSLKTLIIWGVVTVIVSIIDYVVPMWFTKVTGDSKYAERGAIARTYPRHYLHPDRHDTRFIPRCSSVGMVLYPPRLWSSLQGSHRFFPGLHYGYRPQDHCCGSDDVEDHSFRFLVFCISVLIFSLLNLPSICIDRRQGEAKTCG